MELFKDITAYVEKHRLISSGQTIIVGLSGGPDSVLLLHYILTIRKQLNLTIIAAHLNHEWRVDSEQDMLFCKHLCEQLEVPFVHEKISQLNYQAKASGSKEQDARNARRYFFAHVAQTYNADRITLAQHKNDQEETFFIRLLRGASLTGLCSIWPKKGMYVRPLLATLKSDIYTWLEQHDVPYITDPSNISQDFLRNRIRHTLLPTINEIDHRFSTTLFNTIERLQETEHFLTMLTKKTFNQVATYNAQDQAYHVDKQAFLDLEPFLQYRVLMKLLTTQQVPFGASHAFLEEIIRFIKQPESKTHRIHLHWSITKDNKQFYIQPT